MQVTHLFNKLQLRGKMISADELEYGMGGVAGSVDNNELSPRQVLLASSQSMKALNINPGDFRENILIDGLVVEDLPSGTVLKIGEVELSTTFLCEPCGYMDHVRKGLKRQSVGKRGMLAIVLKSGKVKTGDKIEVIKLGTQDWNLTYQKFAQVLSQIPPELLVKGSDLLEACQLETSYFRVMPGQLKKIFASSPELCPERVVSEKGISYMTKFRVEGGVWELKNNMFR